MGCRQSAPRCQNTLEHGILSHHVPSAVSDRPHRPFDLTFLFIHTSRKIEACTSILKHTSRRYYRSEPITTKSAVLNITTYFLELLLCLFSCFSFPHLSFFSNCHHICAAFRKREQFFLVIRAFPARGIHAFGQFSSFCIKSYLFLVFMEALREVVQSFNSFFCIILGS